jgi:hypothetical protein
MEQYGMYEPGVMLSSLSVYTLTIDPGTRLPPSSSASSPVASSSPAHIINLLIFCRLKLNSCDIIRLGSKIS